MYTFHVSIHLISEQIKKSNENVHCHTCGELNYVDIFHSQSNMYEKNLQTHGNIGNCWNLNEIQNKVRTLFGEFVTVKTLGKSGLKFDKYERNIDDGKCVEIFASNLISHTHLPFDRLSAVINTHSNRKWWKVNVDMMPCSLSLSKIYL